MLTTPWFGTNLTLIPVIVGLSWWLWRKWARPDLTAQLIAVQLGSYLLNPSLKALYDARAPESVRAARLVCVELVSERSRNRERVGASHGGDRDLPREGMAMAVLSDRADRRRERLLAHLSRRALADGRVRRIWRRRASGSR